MNREDAIKKTIESGIYAPSSKPWEKVNLMTFLSWKSTLNRYVFAISSVIVTYTELLCYFFMLIATIVKAGYLYMVYPFMIFGYCMLEE